MVISWRLQAVLAILLGPCLLAGYGFLNDFFRAVLRTVHFEFVAATSLLSISFSTATILYLILHKVFFEYSFLYYLATVQFYTLFTGWLAGRTFHSKHVRWWSIGYVLCGFTMYVVTISLIFASVVVDSSIPIPEFLLACIDYDTGTPTSVPELARNSNLIRDYKGDWVMTVRSAKGIVSCVFTVLWVPAAVILFSRAYGWRFSQQLHTLIASSAVVVLVVSLVRMEQNRSMVRTLAGKDFTGDEWGFGQFLPIFIWLPILLRVFFSFLGYVNWGHFKPSISRQVSTLPLSLSSGFGRITGPALTTGEPDPEGADEPQTLIVRRKTA